MQAGNEGEVLLDVVDRLCRELGYAAEEGEVPGARSPLILSEGMSDILTAQDESLVATIRRGLAQVVAAVSAAHTGDAPSVGVRAALDGAEMVIRGELVSGNAAQLPSLMPSFVFMVTLPVVDHDAALDLSHRVAELIKQAELG